ncbi:uncharacterized protein Dmoj_GI26878 [Drosophila mojavensis]|uniref:General transcription factor IIF subunit 2 n=1 Tax=Drosophila mojavensis TaxID=7230 RepID=A0A0Q9XSB6_DROMO|nr:uncharacterized protein Dmoj_GI26878 [Drosophila mojavensis]
MPQDTQENGNKKNNLSEANRAIWLVKVPKYLGKLWDKSPSEMEVATIRIQKPAISSEPFKVSLSLTPELMELEPDSPIASEHELKLCKTTEGTNLTGIFSTLDNEEQSIEGWITHKMQCLPVYNTQYLKMKEHYLRSAKPPRRVKPLNHIVKNYKPVSSHAHNKDDCKRKDGPKMLSKDNIMDLLFQAFEKHQYYTLKDLQFITKQSVFVLKAILKDIGDYNKDPAHKKMWELKEEYRHY